jgi:acid phosphatase family membrane protein YuiD
VTKPLVEDVFGELVQSFLSDSAARRPRLQQWLPDVEVELELVPHAAADDDAPTRPGPTVRWPAAAPPAPGNSWEWEQREQAPPDGGSCLSAPGTERQTPADTPPEVRAVQAAVADLATAPASGRPGDVAAVLALAEQLRGLALRELAEMDTTGSFLSAGALSTATWVRNTQMVSDLTARAKVRVATTLRDDLPQVDELLRHGGTTLEHAAAVVAGTRGLDKTVVRDSQDAICTLLGHADPQTVREQLRERAEVLNQELGRDAERRAHARRGVTADTVPNGVVLGGSYGVEEGHEFLLGLDLAVEADRVDGNTRSLWQRRADALLDWSRRAAAAHGAPAGSVAEDLHTTRSHLIVTCTAEQLAGARRLLDAVGQLRAAAVEPGSADAVAGSVWPWGAPSGGGNGDLGARVRAGASFGPGALVSSEVLRRLTCDAAVSLAVVPDAPVGDNPLGLRPDPTIGGQDPLYVGRAARIVTAAQWRALVIRDRRRVIKGCRRRAAQCQAHHVEHWLDGGRADLDNLVKPEYVLIRGDGRSVDRRCSNDARCHILGDRLRPRRGRSDWSAARVDSQPENPRTESRAGSGCTGTAAGLRQALSVDPLGAGCRGCAGQRR